MALVDTSSHTYQDEMQAKIANFLEDSPYGQDDDVADDDNSVGSNLLELDVPDHLEQNSLDRIVLACCDLQSGLDEFEKLTGLKGGIKTTNGGGAGTKSSLVALDNNTFIEIMGPDPNTSEGMSETLQEIPQGKLVAFHFDVRRHPDAVDIPEEVSWETDNVIMVGSGSPSEYDEAGEMYKPYDPTVPDQIAEWAEGEGFTVPGTPREVFGTG